MIGRVLKRGSRVAGLLYYLYGPGKACVHSNPHLVSGWRHPAELEPQVRENGRRDFRRLTEMLELPLAGLGNRAPAKPVWHCVVRAAPGDPDLGDGAWMRIAGEIMHRTGLSRYGEEGQGVRWVAVHHGENHIHLAATLARQDGRPARLNNDWYRIGEALRDIELEYGLQVVVRADRTAAKRPTRAEQEKAAQARRPEPPRVTLQRQVAAAAAGTRSQPEFFAALEKRGLKVRLRQSTHNPGEITGYAVGLDGDVTEAGDQVWYGGGKLAPDLSLLKLRRRWPEPGRQAHREHRDTAGIRPRLDGHGMAGGMARATLRREVRMCAAAARSEQEFFAGLDAAGLLVRLHYSTDRPGEVSGYAVSLPGMTHHRDGQEVWYGGQTMDGQLSLGALRRRWQAGHPGTPPAPEAFATADTGDIFGYAAAVTDAAARQLRASPPPAEAADIAWAAADVLTAAAEAVGSPELLRAADGFNRAARAPWGRIPPPSPGGAALRTAAYLLAACTPDRSRRIVTRLALVSALTGLARAVAKLRESQNRLLQAAAAHSAAAGLAVAAAGNGPAAPPQLAAADFPQPAAPLQPAAPPSGPPGPGRGRAGDTPGQGLRARRSAQRS
jgi:hypothetical protein